MNRGLLASVACVVLILTGCGDDAPSTATTPSLKPAQTADYAGAISTSVYFSTPKWDYKCAILPVPDGKGAEAGCTGKFPDSTPKVPNQFVPGMSVKPNSVSVNDTGPGGFALASSPVFEQFDRPTKVLPYGATLAADGLTCAVDEKTGVTCQSDAHGFTISDATPRTW